MSNYILHNMRTLLSLGFAVLLTRASTDAQDRAPVEDGANAMPHLVRSGVLDTIIASDYSWGLLVTELAEKWGEAREHVMQQFQKIHEGGVINVGWANVHDSLIGADGDERSLAVEFNITGVPTLLFWFVGTGVAVCAKLHARPSPRPQASRP